MDGWTDGQTDDRQQVIRKTHMNLRFRRAKKKIRTLQNTGKNNCFDFMLIWTFKQFLYINLKFKNFVNFHFIYLLLIPYIINVYYCFMSLSIYMSHMMTNADARIR